MRVLCDKCRIALPVGHTGDCPKCGGTTTRKFEVRDTVALGVRELLGRGTREEFYRRHPKAKWIVAANLVIIPLVTAILGLVLDPITGVFISIASGVLTHYLLPPAHLLVQRITRDESAS